MIEIIVRGKMLRFTEDEILAETNKFSDGSKDVLVHKGDTFFSVSLNKFYQPQLAESIIGVIPDYTETYIGREFGERGLRAYYRIINGNDSIPEW